MATAAESKAKRKWGRYVLMGLGLLGAYHILSGPSGAINLMRLRQANAEKRASLDSLAIRQQELEVELFR